MPSTEVVIAGTRTWLERAVIGLGLCPFAAAAQAAGRIQYSVSAAESTDALVVDLSAALLRLRDADPDRHETLLLIHPGVLTDFLDYNEFLRVADRVVVDLQLEGRIQIASFHPRYRFAGSGADDIENYTNRSPYPMLHLLPEASVTRAVETFSGVDEIATRNIATLRELGHAGWTRLWH